MLRWSTCLLTVMPIFVLACGGEAQTTSPDAGAGREVTEPVHVDELSLTPGCYAPVAQFSTCATSTCTQARAANEALETAATEALAPYVQLTETLARNPLGDDWTFTYEWPAPSVLKSDFLVSAVARGEAGVLKMTIHDHGTWSPGGGQASQEVDAISVVYASYTPNFALVDLETAVARWTSHVVTVGSLYRGCDPVTEVSFDARWNDDGVYDLYCWDRAGHLRDCGTVDLWPH